MKVLVFAHVPPPHHGQSFMVQQMIERIGGGDNGIEIVHVDVRLSQTMDDIGGAGLTKLLKLIGFCLQAIWKRFRHGAKTFYYVPAPPKRATLYRDWIVMAMCRPFFKHIVFHWHAVGLGWWVDGKAEVPSPPKPWEAKLTRGLLGRVDLSISLSEFNCSDAEVLKPKSVAVVPNGIPDPCPDFALRTERADGALRVLYLGHCEAEKGLFDAVAAVKIANEELGPTGQVKLTVAGEFREASERERFEKEVDGSIEYIGFVGGDEKRDAMRDHDCLCFATYYSAESFGLVLVEAMAFGLFPVASDWRTVGELARSAGLDPVPVRDPEKLARRFAELALDPPVPKESLRLRQHFLGHFTIGAHITALGDALKTLEGSNDNA